MIETSEITKKTTAETDIIDLTEEVAAQLSRAGVRAGHVIVFTPGSTAGVTTIEYEPGVVDDLRKAIERLAPAHIPYQHDARWGDGNGYAHVRSAIVGPSLVVPIAGGKMILGTWQQIVLLDFDNRPRDRRIILQIYGE